MKQAFSWPFIDRVFAGIAESGPTGQGLREAGRGCPDLQSGCPGTDPGDRWDVP